jgi:hypothetical protein
MSLLKMQSYLASLNSNGTKLYVAYSSLPTVVRLWLTFLDLQEPLLFSELFIDLVANIIPDYLEDWDNMSTGETINDLPSIEACDKACIENKDCFQFSYNGPECRLSTDTFTLGVPRTPEDGNQWRSTWNKNRIMNWVLKQKPCGAAKFSFKTDVSCG